MADWLITQKLKLATTFNPFGLFIAGFILMPIGFCCCIPSFGSSRTRSGLFNGSPRSE